MDRSGDARLVLLLLFMSHMTTALEVPLDPKLLEGLPQPPTITHQSPKDYIVDPRENIVIYCEAKGKPHPSFSWTRNGTHFDIEKDPKVIMKPHTGTLVIDISGGEKTEAYEGIYQCAAHNQLGTAVSSHIHIRQSNVFSVLRELILAGSPLWSKERFSPIVAQKGQSLVLHCRPPAGLPPPIVFWMDNNFQRLPQSRRVSQGLNGDLYFSNVQMEDSRNNYICYARFPHTQTIQQKQPISVHVTEHKPIEERAPVFMVPSGSLSSELVLRGETLEMECIADGLPTPAVSWSKRSGEIPSARASFLNYNKTLRITDVSEADAGEYQCRATNTHGSVHHTYRVTVRAAPYWISAPKNLVLAPLETGAISCLAGGNPKPTIHWSVNGLPINDAPKDPSRRVENDTIIFSAVQTGSSAVYQCNATNQYGDLLYNAFVNVLAEPPRVLTPSDKVYQVIVNKPALLECVSFGSPVPTITWFKDSRSSMLDGDPYVFHDSGALEIPVSQGSNSGKYTCVARNNLGISENHVYLEVKEPTRILRPPEYRVVQRNADVLFECKVKHDPSLVPTVSWRRDNGELPYDERFRVEADSLTISDVSESDAGVYTCMVNTTLDQDSASAQLTVVEQPDAPTDLELTDPGARSVQLTWTPGDEHNSPTKKFLIQYEDALHQSGVWLNLTEVPGSRTTAHLKLSPYVHYSFRVLALNDVGYSRPSRASRQYRTSPAAPDENPSEVKGHGTEHNNLVITWKPLTPLQANGPGLQYKVMWRQQEVEQDWSFVTVANVSRFVVSGTPTFVPYELKVQAINDYGHAPKPSAVIGHSGEDFPSAAPEAVQVLVLNSTEAEVSWTHVPQRSVRGRLQGYRVHYRRERSLHRHNSHHAEQRSKTFSTGSSSGRLTDLQPYSLYSLHITALSGRGEGPASNTHRFQTPEGVPGAPASLRVSAADPESVLLEWSPPHQRNGRLTGYTLRYHAVSSSSDAGELQELELPANHSSVFLHSLQHSTRYRFSLSARTARGSGPPLTQETLTVLDRALVSPQVDIATQGWFIGLMSAIALLILILLIICFIKRNKGGKYPVKEKEDAHGDPEIQPMKEDDMTFGEYSDEDHKPLKGSRTPSSGSVKRADSDDSLVDYTDSGDTQFNEDGSFIGQYSGLQSAHHSPQPSPSTAFNSLV
ncbi:neuronal cell adhesion molecule isoform X13 [Danio rerio]|uniref:Neuronal cell adhesion molecule isoform X13 n=1 Tax=Danio rerio TaxID=7955 RepID=A0AC58IWA4_DANRE